MAELSIPRRLSHIWIGPLAPPHESMRTWPALHPEWEYRIYDNAYLEKTTFRTQPQIDEYLKRGNYEGVADLMRYEILHKDGGFMAGADSFCLHNIDELFLEGDLFTVYENEFLRGQLVAPVIACKPGNKFVDLLINTLANTDPRTLDDPWRSVGNKFVTEMIEEHQPDIKIFPSHFFIPIHYSGRVYRGAEKVYAKQLFGSTRKIYQQTDRNILQRMQEKFARMRQKNYRRKALARAKKFRSDFFDIEY